MNRLEFKLRFKGGLSPLRLRGSLLHQGHSLLSLLPCQIQIGGGENAWQEEGKLVEERRAEEKERNGERLGLPTRLSVEDGLQR